MLGLALHPSAIFNSQLPTILIIFLILLNFILNYYCDFAYEMVQKKQLYDKNINIQYSNVHKGEHHNLILKCCQEKNGPALKRILMI